MPVNVGDLVATLRLDTSKVSTAVQQAERDLQKYSVTVAAEGGRAERSLTTSADRIALAQKAAGEEMNRLSGSHLPMLSQAASAAEDRLTSLGLSGGVLSKALTFLTNPLTLVAAGLASVSAAAFAGVRAFSDNASEVKQLVAVSGLSAEAADNLADTMRVLGADTGTLTTALFRLGNEVDTGGQSLAKFGINILTTTGRLKEPGDLLLEVRDRISQMGDAGQRSATLMDIFGRSGRALAPIFALNREEFAKWAKVAADASPWNEEHQKLAIEYQRNLALLSLTWSGMAEAIGATVVPALTGLLGWITGVLNAIRSAVAAVKGFGSGAASSVAKGPGLSGTSPGTSVDVSDTPGFAPNLQPPTSRLSPQQILAPLAIPKEQFAQGAIGVTAYAAALATAIERLKGIAGADVEAAKALTPLLKEYDALVAIIAGPLGEALDSLDKEQGDAIKQAQDFERSEGLRIRKLIEEQSELARTAAAYDQLDSEFVDAVKSARAFEAAEHKRIAGLIEEQSATARVAAAYDEEDAAFQKVTAAGREYERQQNAIGLALRGVTGIEQQNTVSLVKHTQELHNQNIAAEENAVAVARAAQEETRAQGSYFGFLKASLAEQAALWPSTWDSIKSLTVGAFGSLQHTLSDTFFDVMQGKITSFSDAVKSLWTGMLGSIERAVADFMAQAVVRQFLGLLFGGTSLGGDSGIVGSVIGGLAGLLGNILHEGGTVGGSGGAQPALLQSGEVVVSSSVARLLGLPSGGTGITEAFMSSDAVQNAITSLGLRDLLGMGGGSVGPSGISSSEAVRDAIEAAGGFVGGGATAGTLIGTTNTEFLSAATGASSGVLGTVIPAAGAAFSLAQGINALVQGNVAAGAGTLGGLGIGAGIGFIAGGPIGALIGSGIGGGAGGFLGGLFGGGNAEKLRKKKEAEASRHAALASAVASAAQSQLSGGSGDVLGAHLAAAQGGFDIDRFGGSLLVVHQGMESQYRKQLAAGDLSGHGQRPLERFAEQVGVAIQDKFGVTDLPGDIDSPHTWWQYLVQHWPPANPLALFDAMVADPVAFRSGVPVSPTINPGPGFNEALSFLNQYRSVPDPATLTGFRTGGSFVVGGSGGPDSQLVNFMASPGERVDVTPTGGGVPGTLVVKVVLDGHEVGEAVVDFMRRQGLAGRKFVPDSARFAQNRA